MPAEDRQRLGHPVGPWHHAIDEIRAVERADELHRVAEVQLPGDVVPQRGNMPRVVIIGRQGANRRLPAHPRQRRAHGINRRGGGGA